MSGFIPQVVRANYRCITAGIATANPAFFQYGHIGDLMLGSKIVGSRQTMPSPADNNGIVGGFRFRVAPCPRPLGVTAHRMPYEAKD